MFFWYKDTAPPVNPTEVVAQANPTAGRRQRCSRKVSPYPVILKMNTSSGIHVKINPGWQVMVLYFATLAIRPTLMKSLMIKLMAHWIYSG